MGAMRKPTMTEEADVAKTPGAAVGQSNDFALLFELIQRSLDECRNIRRRAT